MAQFGWCSLKSSRRLSTHIHLQINKINSIFPNILPLFQRGCRSQQKTPLGRVIPLQCFGSENTIQLGNFASMPFGHLRSGPSTVSCVPLRGTCLRRTPTHYSSPWADGSLAVCVSRFFGNNVLNCGIALGVYCWLTEVSVIISQPEKHL